MANRRADSVTFGFDFQVNAAIILMLENILELQSLRLEGNHEDIELSLTDGSMVIAQAKSVQHASSDFRNVLRNLQNAIISLSDGANGVNVRELIYVTNSPNPLHERNLNNLFYGHAHQKFKDLPKSSQDIIQKQYAHVQEKLINQSIKPIDITSLHIQVIPFESDNERERYKVVKQVIDEFVFSLDANLQGASQRLLETWQNNVFINSTKENADITLTKQDIIWPMLVFVTDIQKCDQSFWDNYDQAVYNEVVRKYGTIIQSSCERFEFFTKVLSDFSDYEYTGTSRNKVSSFINTRWKMYLEEFPLKTSDSDVQQAIIQVVLYNITRNRIVINQIKKEVNL